MAVRCPDCGTEFEDGTLFCDQCGTELPFSEEEETKLLLIAYVKCPHCGWENLAGEVFCQNPDCCGLPFSELVPDALQAYVKCPNCGWENPVGVVFCQNPDCGLQFSSSKIQIVGYNFLQELEYGSRVRKTEPMPEDEMED
jgi:DNA-directed RNA polymerase subunit RPC12/RpoP